MQDFIRRRSASRVMKTESIPVDSVLDNSLVLEFIPSSNEPENGFDHAIMSEPKATIPPRSHTQRNSSFRRIDLKHAA